MMKGHSDSGRKFVALALATTLDCLLIDEDNLCKVTDIANEPRQVCYQDFSRITLSQLQIGLSVVFDSDLTDKSKLSFLQDLAIANKTPIIIVECKQWGEDNKDFVCDTPKLVVHVTTPTFDGIKDFMPHILDYISARSKQSGKRHSKEPKTPSCYRHTIRLGSYYGVSEGEICNRCSKKLLNPVLKCKDCSVLHKNRTELPLRISVNNYDLFSKNMHTIMTNLGVFVVTSS